MSLLLALGIGQGRGGALLAGILCLVACRSSGTEAQPAPDTGGAPLRRTYVAGEQLGYVMTASNRNRESTRHYTAECQGRVVQTDDGTFYEEFRWIRLEVDGQEIALDDASRSFVQRLSLDPDYELGAPDIRGVNPMLIGPIFDLMTFYVDTHPSLHQGRLARRGDRMYVAHGQPNSWADGTRVLVGEDCIDFELTLADVGPESAQLLVRHVPPRESSIHLPAAWMREPVGDGPNNWVQIVKDASSAQPAYIAAVGRETFDVRITLERPAGRMVAATMDNPVDVLQRRCADAELLDCGEPVQYRIQRIIELRAQP